MQPRALVLDQLRRARARRGADGDAGGHRLDRHLGRRASRGDQDCRTRQQRTPIAAAAASRRQHHELALLAREPAAKRAHRRAIVAGRLHQDPRRHRERDCGQELDAGRHDLPVAARTRTRRLCHRSGGRDEGVAMGDGAARLREHELRGGVQGHDAERARTPRRAHRERGQNRLVHVHDVERAVPRHHGRVDRRRDGSCDPRPARRQGRSDRNGQGPADRRQKGVGASRLKRAAPLAPLAQRRPGPRRPEHDDLVAGLGLATGDGPDMVCNHPRAVDIERADVRDPHGLAAASRRPSRLPARAPAQRCGCARR